jgi:hypothetical protein
MEKKDLGALGAGFKRAWNYIALQHAKQFTDI